VSVGGWVRPGTDVNEPSPARMHDYYLGGWHHFPADRWAAEQALQVSPELPAVARANRSFLHRAVRHLVAAGVGQFLDLGSGIPTAGCTHEVAGQHDPQARVVYVDVDPVAVAHGQALLGHLATADIVRADLRDVPLVLAAPAVRQLIDVSRPVGVLMISVLQWLSDSDDPAGVVARYRDAVPAGSYLIVSHPTTIDARAGGGGQPGASWPDRGRSRTREEIGALFAGWQLQAPGLVTLDEWRADLGAAVATEAGARPHLAAVGRK
jgi:S-adenosyl methyltransferase